METYLLEDLIGLHTTGPNLSMLQVLVRTVIIFFCALVIVRIADRRSLARSTPFDVIVGYLLASTLSRAINGSAAFLPTIACGFLLVFLHKLLATVTFYSHLAGSWIKGCDDVLYEEGEFKSAALRRQHITRHDIDEAIRSDANVGRLEKVDSIRIERSGELSVIKR